MVRKRPQSLSENNKNYFVFLLLIISVLGVAWGSFTEVKAGILYLSIFLTSTGVIVLAQFFVNENDKKTIKQFFKTPFSSSPLVSSAMWLFGFYTIIFINLIGSLFKQGFSTVEFFSPLYLSAGGLSSGISQSFQAGVIENSEFANWFYGVFVAGTIEEFTWAFALPLAFWIIGILIVQMFFNNKFPYFENKTFYFWFSMIFSVLTFMQIHQLNGSYVGIMFLVAGIFRFILNFAVYFIGFVISFNIGIHMSNNNFAWIMINGLPKFIEILFTNIYGLAILFLFVGLNIYVLKNLNKIFSLVADEVRSFRR